LTYVGQKPLQLRELSLSDLVRESVTGLKGEFNAATSLKFTPPDHSLYCSGDDTQIKEVIESVLTNAIESLNDEGGMIEVTFGAEHYTTDSFSLPFQDADLREGMYAYFQIQDTGHGISAGNLSQIFEPFYTTKFVGRGLGLALTVGILQAHHGAIIVDSTLGKGTTVRVLFPLVSPVTKQITSVPKESSTVETKPSMTGNILFADDEPIILLAGQMMLEQFGFTVYTAANGLEAVEMVRSGREFRAIVLDILMPEMDGIEAMQEIRKIDPTIPILLISGYSEDDLPLDDDQENRPDAFIAKPVRLADMQEKLEMLLG
jgi:CheY-like chemotaxis protein